MVETVDEKFPGQTSKTLNRDRNISIDSDISSSESANEVLKGIEISTSALDAMQRKREQVFEKYQTAEKHIYATT